ncbi:MAG: aldo/keto reductase [Nitrospirota bacterium]|nr:aldo/keto reductase [Nitrospirota bacterium]
MAFSRRLNRRELLKALGFAGATVALTGPLDWAKALGEVGAQASTGTVPRRPLGRTGVEVSALCLGGAHLSRFGSEAEAVSLVHEAIDAGIDFMDNAWEYAGGRAEEWMGKALVGRRDKVFLMTKVCSHGRDKHVAMQQLEESLRRLRTDYLDLWQIHEVIYEDDPDRHFAPGGAVEALVEAKKQGKVRFIGFTGHKDPTIHLKMLARNFPFDTCQLPLNVFDGTFRSFERDVLPELTRRGIAPLAMKTLSGNGEPIKQRVITPEEALCYVLSLPVATVVSGIDSRAVLKQNLDIVRRFVPMSQDERVALRTRVAVYAADGRFELFKSSRAYDGRIGREQHQIQS